MTLALTLPAPTFALRPTGLEEQEVDGRPRNSKGKLMTALDVPVEIGIPSSSPSSSPAASVSTAGLEEGVWAKVLSGHTDWVWGVAISADGTKLVSASEDRTVRLWDTFTGRELRELAGAIGKVRAVAISADGKRVVFAGRDGTVRLVETATGKELSKLSDPTGGIRAVAISADGTKVASAGGGDGTVRLWDADTGKELSKLTGHTSAVLDVAISADGTRVASAGGDGTVRLWDADTGKELSKQISYLDAGGVRYVAISADGKRVVFPSMGGMVRLWDTDTEEKLSKRTGHIGEVLDVAISADGKRVVFAGQDGTVFLWDAVTGRELRELASAIGGIRGVAISADGTRVASAGEDGKVHLWEVEPAAGLEESLEVQWGTMVARAEGFSGGWTTDKWIKAQGLIRELVVESGFFASTEGRLSIEETAERLVISNGTGSPLEITEGAAPRVLRMRYKPETPDRPATLTLFLSPETGVPAQEITGLTVKADRNDTDHPLILRIEPAAGLEEGKGWMPTRRDFLAGAFGAGLTAAGMSLSRTPKAPPPVLKIVAPQLPTLPGLGDVSPENALVSVLPANLGIPAAPLPGQFRRDLASGRVVFLVADPAQADPDDFRYSSIEDALIAIGSGDVPDLIVLDHAGDWVLEAPFVLPRGVSLVGGTSTTRLIGDIVADGGTVANVQVQGEMTLRGGSRFLNSVLTGQMKVQGDGNQISGNRVVSDERVAMEIGTPEAPSSRNEVSGNLVVAREKAALQVVHGNDNQVAWNTLVGLQAGTPALLVGPWRSPLDSIEVSSSVEGLRVEGNVLAIAVSPSATPELPLKPMIGRPIQWTRRGNVVVGEREAPLSLDRTTRYAESFENAFEAGTYRLVPGLLSENPVGVFRQVEDEAGLEEGGSVVMVGRDRLAEALAGMIRGVVQGRPGSSSLQLNIQAPEVQDHHMGFAVENGIPEDLVEQMERELVRVRVTPVAAGVWRAQTAVESQSETDPSRLDISVVFAPVDSERVLGLVDARFPGYPEIMAAARAVIEGALPLDAAVDQIVLQHDETWRQPTRNMIVAAYVGAMHDLYYGYGLDAVLWAVSNPAMPDIQLLPYLIWDNSEGRTEEGNRDLIAEVRRLAGVTIGPEEQTAAKVKLLEQTIRTLGDTMPLLARPDQVVDLAEAVPYLAGLLREAGYAQGTAVLVPAGSFRGAFQLAGLKVFVQGSQRDTVIGKLSYDLDIQFTDNLSEANLVIGDASFDPGLKSQYLASRQGPFLEVNRPEVAQQITRTFLENLRASHLLLPGTVLFLDRLVTGDFGEAILLFA